MRVVRHIARHRLGTINLRPADRRRVPAVKGIARARHIIRQRPNRYPFRDVPSCRYNSVRTVQVEGHSICHWCWRHRRTVVQRFHLRRRQRAVVNTKVIHIAIEVFQRPNNISTYRYYIASSRQGIRGIITTNHNTIFENRKLIRS